MACCKDKERSEFDNMAEGEERDSLREIHVPVKKTGLFGSVYYNNPPSWKEWYKPGALPFLKMKCLEKNEAGIPSNEEDLNKELPVHKIDGEGKKTLERPKSDIQYMWIGHATFLVQFDDITVLTDPVFLYRCSPVQVVGPYRYRPTPCEIEDLPKIDAVIVSHNHYDHLEHDAVIKLNNRFSKIKWYVPEGTKTWFQKYDCNNVKEMTWWEENTLSDERLDVKFCCVPAQHWSQRTPIDAMKSLWCGWVIKAKHTFYYSGDTGYCPVFKTIGEKYGPMDLSAIPIGCYAPRDFMKPQHIGPKEAVMVHEEVGSKFSVGIHWGTFNGLGSHEFYLEPRDLLIEEVEKAKKVNKNLGDFITVEHGEIKTIDDSVGAKL
ncbi:N-acyl-phosphatidylethanolamine-hydrolyzing phospholipase D-like [Mytilus californianus]|uniref:N-acyl-phosphatidylethanolamine-hydrolyzing phospholipase D-like n=1 Tax=Mytilus californianus TaxID=6549 RepID=UPI002245B731|nr:N-acyl-phosphatidylethanolamine-hydrolyzing phospholipase D-like [Mytilus californianus]